MRENDADAKDIRGYLKALLTELWAEGEGFSGKRPFGNSGWEYELYVALIMGGVVKGTLDEGYVQDISDTEKRKATRLIAEAIEAL